MNSIYIRVSELPPDVNTLYQLPLCVYHPGASSDNHVLSLPCKGGMVAGQHVIIHMLKSQLTLCEVAVYTGREMLTLCEVEAYKGREVVALGR